MMKSMAQLQPVVPLQESKASSFSFSMPHSIY